MMRRLVLLLVLVASVAALGACGRKGAPEFPPDNEFPRRYPAQ